MPLSVRDLLGCITPDIESMLSGLGDRNVVIGEGEEDVVRCFSTMLSKFKSSALIVGLTLLLALSLLLNPFVGELDESLAWRVTSVIDRLFMIFGYRYGAPQEFAAAILDSN